MRHQGGNRESTLYGVQGRSPGGEVQEAGGGLLLRGTGAQSPRKPSDEEQRAGAQSPGSPQRSEGAHDTCPTGKTAVPAEERRSEGVFDIS